jgi:hypothetical protein
MDTTSPGSSPAASLIAPARMRPAYRRCHDALLTDPARQPPPRGRGGCFLSAHVIRVGRVSSFPPLDDVATGNRLCTVYLSDEDR